MELLLEQRNALVLAPTFVRILPVMAHPAPSSEKLKLTRPVGHDLDFIVLHAGTGVDNKRHDIDIEDDTAKRETF